MTTPTPLHGPTQDFLKALASETRQQIMLLFTGGKELTVGEVADCCGLGQSTTSEQLTILRRGGLVQSTRDGKLVRYRADPTTINARLGELQTYLACCCPPVTDDSADSIKSTSPASPSVTPPRSPTSMAACTAADNSHDQRRPPGQQTSSSRPAE
ncbi:metalloregulator ArsR/SmtB family transcription factor [Dactylosporangium sp. NPDC050688]|uniref:ArsR/SmtB family transcription factor n=1 Tax=Dactylosporangium sp. NPDC050688 TaxID=3157217 RepID=UPI003404BCA6